MKVAQLSLQPYQLQASQQIHIILDKTVLQNDLIDTNTTNQHIVVQETTQLLIVNKLFYLNPH